MKDQLKVNFSKEQDYDLLEIAGGISYSDVPLLQKEMDNALKKQTKNIIIDFSQVNYISSAGLRIFLKFKKTASKEGKKVILCGLNEFTSSIFKISGVDKVFNIQMDKAKAIQSLLK